MKGDCVKCGQNDNTVSFKHIGEKIYWSEHKKITNISKFTRNDKYYTSDSIVKECLVLTCNVCGYKTAVPTKDNE